MRKILKYSLLILPLLLLTAGVQQYHRAVIAQNRQTAAAPGTIAFVQSKGDFQSGFGSDTLAFDTAITAGNTIIFTVGVDNSDVNVTNVTDNRGNTYQLAVKREAESNRQVYIYYALNAAAGATTISVAYSAACSGSIIGGEFSGITALDTTIAGTIGTTNPINPGTITPTVNNTVVITTGVTVNTATSFTPGAGLTLLFGTMSRLCTQYEILSGGASVAQNTECTMQTVRSWSAVAATFKP